MADQPTGPAASNELAVTGEPTDPTDLVPAPGPHDPFPRSAWDTLASHAAGYLRLTLALLRDPAVGRHRRAALLAAAAYFASPIDLVPGIIPVFGQLDDLAVAMLAIRLALNALEPHRRQAHLAAAGLSDETLREDITAAATIGGWAARTGGRLGLRAGRATLRLGADAGRKTLHLGGDAGRKTLRLGADAGRAAGRFVRRRRGGAAEDGPPVTD